MGRPVPSGAARPDTVSTPFAGFRQGLDERERRAFDRLVERARVRAPSVPREAPTERVEVMFLSALLDQELEIERLSRALDDLSWRSLGRPAAPLGELDAFAAPCAPAPRADGEAPSDAA